MRHWLLLVSSLAAVLPGAAAAEEVLVPDEVCRYLTRHEAAPDVAYRPGVDVNGRPVAPADLPGSVPVAPPREVGVALTIPLADLLGAATPPLLDAAEVDAGTVSVDRVTGAVLYNGSPLADPGAARLAALCRMARGHGR